MQIHTKIAIALASFLFIAGAAISTDNAGGEAETKGPTVIAPTDSSVKEKLTDITFIEKAAQASIEESMLSKIALEKSSNAKLKKFAQTVVDSSTRTMEKLRAVGSENRLAIPAQLNAEQNKMIGQMQQLEGAAFDQAYADVMQKIQDSTVALYDNAAGEGTLNVNLRVFANKVLPELRKNQKLAHALKPTTPDASAAAAPPKR